MPKIVNTDPFCNNPNWIQDSQKTITKGKLTYTQIKYHSAAKHSLAWKVARGAYALFASVVIVPALINREFVAKLWRTAHTGIDEKIVNLAHKNNISKTSDSETDQDVDAINPFLQVARAHGLLNPKDIAFQDVDRAEVLALQALIQNPNTKHTQPSLEKLKDQFFPKNKLEIGEATYYVSNPFQLDAGGGQTKQAVLALVKIGPHVFPRVFYHSNSQGHWRVMPAASKRHFLHFGRLGGEIESDTALPMNLNLALQTILDKNSHKKEDIDILHLVKTITPYQDLTETYQANIVLQDFCRIDADAPKMFVKFGIAHNGAPEPKFVHMPDNEQLNPDFETCLYENSLVDPHYGPITQRVFASKDKTVQYLFIEASDGRAFLSYVELVNDNPINCFGVRSKALEVNGMDKPLLEYRQQIPERFDALNAPKYGCQDRNYDNCWNYVRELPIIQAYYRERKLLIPDAF